MSSSLVLSCGEHFIECATLGPEGLSAWSRWYSRPLRGVLDFIDHNNLQTPETLYVFLRGGLSALNKKLGTPPAVLVTHGFEDWMKVKLRPQTSFSQFARHENESIVDEDLVFGVSERLSAEGKVLQELRHDELDFLASKLQLGGITDIAINFLHAPVNNYNEKQAATFFRNKGFNVFTSAEVSTNTGEAERWLTTTVASYLAPYEREYLKEFQEGLEQKLGSSVSLQPLTPEGWSPSLVALGGLAPILHNYFSSNPPLPAGPVLYLGLDDFFLFNLHDTASDPYLATEYGALALPAPSFERLDFQPTQKVEQTDWGTAGWSTPSANPPMSLGRSLEVQFLDVLFANDSLHSVYGLDTALKNSAKKRITESLAALSRPAMSTNNLQAPSITQWLQDDALRRIRHNLARTKELVVGGELAPTLAPLLKKERLAPSIHIADNPETLALRALAQKAREAEQ